MNQSVRWWPLRGALAIACLVASCNAFAANPLDDPVVLACADQASHAFGVPIEVIHVILEVEGGWAGAEIRNTNGSYDLGVMQINTQWLRKLSRFGVTRADIRDNVCVNISVGTWLLASELAAGRTFAEAIARYHSPTRRHQQRYLKKAAEYLERRVAEEEAATSNAASVVSVIVHAPE